MRIFNKILKSLSTFFLGETCFECVYFIHPEKSVLIPTQKLEFLAYIIDAISMTIILTPKRKVKIKTLCKLILSKTSIIMRDSADIR